MVERTGGQGIGQGIPRTTTKNPNESILMSNTRLIMEQMISLMESPSEESNHFIEALRKTFEPLL